MKLRLEDASKFEPNINATFPGIDNLRLRLRNARQTFFFRGKGIKIRGKAIGVSLLNDWWLKHSFTYAWPHRYHLFKKTFHAG